MIKKYCWLLGGIYPQKKATKNMNRQDYKNQFDKIYYEVLNLDLKSGNYSGEEKKPFLTKEGLKFIKQNLKTILINLMNVKNYNGNFILKQKYLGQFYAFCQLINFDGAQLWYELKRILEKDKESHQKKWAQ